MFKTTATTSATKAGWKTTTAFRFEPFRMILGAISFSIACAAISVGLGVLLDDQVLKGIKAII